MSRPWSGGFSPGFGPLSETTTFPISNLNYRNMATLGITDQEILYYDYGETQDFYVLVNPPATAEPNPTLYLVSPSYASRWFGLNPEVNQVYNPFSPTSRYPLSTVV